MGPGLVDAFEMSVNGADLTELERLILEFALYDATNGTPMRSRQSFDRALEQGAELLARLGLRLDARGEGGRPGRARAFALGEAA